MKNSHAPFNDDEIIGEDLPPEEENAYVDASNNGPPNEKDCIAESMNSVWD